MCAEPSGDGGGGGVVGVAGVSIGEPGSLVAGGVSMACGGGANGPVAEAEHAVASSTSNAIVIRMRRLSHLDAGLAPRVAGTLRTNG